MNSTHPQALLAFARKLNRLLLLRVAVQMMTVWFFVWGVVVLALKILRVEHTEWLILGIFGFAPLVLWAGLRERRRRPRLEQVRANYDRLNACGGVVMAQETADMSAWLAQLPAAAVPGFRWHGGRPLLVLFVAALFAAAALLLPERLTHLLGHHPLEIGQIVQQLQAEVNTLAQEKILPDQKADEVEKQLARLLEDSSGYDPSKTWEALDHIKQSNADLAQQAAEAAEQKTESLTEAETLAKAMEQAAEQGMEPATAAQAAQDLASLLNAAKLEEGVLAGNIPPELLQNLSGLDREQMEKLVKALELNKSAFGMTMSNLASLKMIDPAALAKCRNAGHNPDFAGLAAYLAQCQGGKCDSDLLFSWLRKRCRGGPGRGGPEAPMDWDNNTSEDNQKFQAHALPPSMHLSEAQMVGVSKAAPELAANDVAAQHGALDNAAAGGGSAHAQVILPEHRQAVQNFFKRDEK
ncbi:MAG: hypothetical protein ABSH48_01940 [Verrucomicrobiota bacterium]|jgi:hypothetical protein